MITKVGCEVIKNFYRVEVKQITIFMSYNFRNDFHVCLKKEIICSEGILN